MELEAGGRDGAGGAGGAGGRPLPLKDDADVGVGGVVAVRVSDLAASFEGALGLLAGGSGAGGGRGAARAGGGLHLTQPVGSRLSCHICTSHSYHGPNAMSSSSDQPS